MYRQGVSALIINKNKEFLLVNLESFESHFFTIPGGGVEEGESLKEAVYREIEEEIGIGKKSLEFIGECKDSLKFKFKTIKMNRNNIEYEGSERYFFGFKFIGSNEEIKLQEGEVRSYKWVSFENLKNYLLFEDQLDDTLEKIFELFLDFK